MSRGLGPMQRDIVQAAACVKPETLIPRSYMDAGGNGYHERQVYSVSSLRWRVARLRQGVCEEDCTARVPPQLRPLMRRGPHRPHLKYSVLGLGFAASFARAMRTLIARGVFTPVASVYCDLSRERIVMRGGLRPADGRRIIYVARAKR